MTAPTSAIQVWTPSAVQQLISEYPEDRFIALFPRTVLSQVNPLLSPVIETVVLNPDPENGGDVYRSNDLKEHHVALTKVALRRVMSLAGASMVDSRRLDDGSDPLYVLWQVTVERQVPGRPKPERAIGTKEIRLGPDQTKGWTPQRIGKAREHMIRMAEAKACNAALRDLLTLKQQYHVNEVRKPFVVLRWEPNMNHPAVAERFLENLLPATTAAYGPQDQAQQLAAGEQPFDLAPHAPDDDDTVHEGTYTEVRTNGHATVDTRTGEIVAERDAAPDFGLDDPLGMPATAAANRTLADRLKEAAARWPEATGTIAADGPEADRLRELMRPLVVPGAPDKEAQLAVINGGLGPAFGAAYGALQERHIRAIIAVAEQMGDDAFTNAWRAMAGAAGR